MFRVLRATPPIGSSCQSCASSIARPEDQGTDRRGQPVVGYCRRCYRGGEFVEPELTAERMALRVTAVLGLSGMNPMVVANEVSALISTLDRWQTGPAARRS